MVSAGWLCLAAMVVAYGCANLLQSIAAIRTQPHHSMHPSLLLRLASQKTYLIGIGCQIVGFFFAFAARRDLPLFLVQASVSAGLGVMAILGVAILKWKLPLAEIALLVLLGGGIAGLVVSAKPGASRPITATGIITLAGVLAVIALLGVFATRLRGAAGSVALGALAGLAFGAAAVDSRALASAHSWQAFALHPLMYLLFAHSLTGQLMLGMAMQRGSTTAAVAAMDAASTAPAAIIGLALLGDQIWPGRQWLAAVGFICTLVAVIGLTRFAQPQVGHPNADTVVFAAVAALPPMSHPAPTTPTTPTTMTIHQKPGAHRKGAVRNAAAPVGLTKNRATAG